MPDSASVNNPFEARQMLDTAMGKKTIYRLDALAREFPHVDHLPYTIKVLLESCLRNVDGFIVTEDAVRALAAYDAKKVGHEEVPFMPGRVVLQDFTGVPCVVDLAAMRQAMVRMTGDKKAAAKVNPLVPCDLVIDHSVQVDAFASGAALTINSQLEFERNHERYTLLKWAQQSFDNFRAVPPATGIVHQVNLEYLAKVVWEKDGVLYPDSLVGTDSHTTMINGLGVLGWGVGGIEAEAVMLGQPYYMLPPEVVGMKLIGKLRQGATATDLVLVITQMLRKLGVVGKFVEFYGPGLADMPLANRATIANMAPEYGATCGFFPVDEQTLKYMHLTGRDQKLIKTVEQYCKAQGLWRDDARKIQYSTTLELDMDSVEPCLAGPKRPQDRIALSAMKSTWIDALKKTFAKNDTTLVNNPVGGWTEEGGNPGNQAGNQPVPASGHSSAATAVAEAPPPVDLGFSGVDVELDGQKFKLKHGAVVIAAITSCTNTSNPDVMVAAGLVARKARARGLTRKPWVKTSLAPGSKVVTEYYNKAGLTEDLDALGFNLVGYGCTTCIGNSGPLPEAISKAIGAHDLVACSVLSGNRNFEGRINPDVKANYLASPPLVVAYAIAGTTNIDLTTEPIGQDQDGKDVYLKDIWPSQEEVAKTVAHSLSRADFEGQYADVFKGSAEWRAIDTATGELYAWDAKSTYVQEPPFFVDMAPQPEAIKPIENARVLVMVGDSVTTDHISPAGSIKKDSPAGKYLMEHGVTAAMFNSYGARRGNDRVMTRGTFANIRVRNLLAPGTEGGVTTYLGNAGGADAERSKASGTTEAGQVMPIYDAAMKYQASHTTTIVLAGKDYGMGSSRDWAAKGTFLLGARAVIAESFERIHRSNLVGMGVLPLTFKEGENREKLGLTGQEVFTIHVDDHVKPRQEVKVTATDPKSGKKKEFAVLCRIDTPVEVQYYRNGGILHTVLRKMAKA
ncbi:MAG: aconitate hydratase [Phycisphaeraceae bacterium]